MSNPKKSERARRDVIRRSRWIRSKLPHDFSQCRTMKEAAALLLTPPKKEEAE